MSTTALGRTRERKAAVKISALARTRADAIVVAPSKGVKPEEPKDNPLPIYLGLAIAVGGLIALARSDIRSQREWNERYREKYKPKPGSYTAGMSPPLEEPSPFHHAPISFPVPTSGSGFSSGGGYGSDFEGFEGEAEEADDD